MIEIDDVEVRFNTEVTTNAALFVVIDGQVKKIIEYAELLVEGERDGNRYTIKKRGFGPHDPMSDGPMTCFEIVVQWSESRAKLVLVSKSDRSLQSLDDSCD